MTVEFTVLAFEPSGHRRVPTPCQLGDIIEWKRQGQTGTVWMVVEEYGYAHGRAKVMARPVGGGRRVRITRGVHHVYSPEGFDRLSGQKRELPHAA